MASAAVASTEDSPVDVSAKSNCVIAPLLDHDDPVTDRCESGAKPFCTRLLLAVNTTQCCSLS